MIHGLQEASTRRPAQGFGGGRRGSLRGSRDPQGIAGLPRCRTFAGSQAPQVDVDLAAPAWMDDFGRRSTAVSSCRCRHRRCCSSRATSSEHLSGSPSTRRGAAEQPGQLGNGDSFAQQILLMDIPAEVRWTVTEVARI
ncbi:hypothetical protein [Aeromicrobium sp. UC242_57]|uniref:hypothetical protein n=1 Tax=Aeromicrobium sp. UC242_57 TaxID=3374624 RepID=UPI0037ABEE53